MVAPVNLLFEFMVGIRKRAIPLPTCSSLYVTVTSHHRQFPQGFLSQSITSAGTDTYSLIPISTRRRIIRP